MSEFSKEKIKEVKLVNSSDLGGLFAADHLISLGYRYQRGIAVPYEVGKSMTVSIENGGPAEYDLLDTYLLNLNLEGIIFIRLDK